MVLTRVNKTIFKPVGPLILPLRILKKWLDSWDNLANERRLLMENLPKKWPIGDLNWQSKTFVHNVQKSFQLLKLCPIPYVSQILSQGFILDDFDYDTPTSVVYALLNPRRKMIYIGETGGKFHKRKLMSRFLEHLHKAFNNNNKQLKDSYSSHWMNGIYHHMSMDGPHNWIIIPLQYTTYRNRIFLEKLWMTKVPCIYNKISRWMPWNRSISTHYCFKKTHMDTYGPNG